MTTARIYQTVLEVPSQLDSEATKARTSQLVAEVVSRNVAATASTYFMMF